MPCESADEPRPNLFNLPLCKVKTAIVIYISWKFPENVVNTPASKLSKKFSVLESEKRRLQTELEDVTRAHASLSRKYDSLLKDNESRIPLTDHMNMVDECRR